MRAGGKILHAILSQIENVVKPGMTTIMIDNLARKLVTDNNVQPSFLGYGGYPAVIFTSVNDEVVHAVPSGRLLNPGDLLKLDFGILYKNFHTDMAVTLVVGGQSTDDEKTRKLKNKLTSVTREALERGIREARLGNTVGDIGWAIQKFVEHNQFNVARDLVGHGIGRQLHELPHVPNFGKAGHGDKLIAGMTIAIEPIVLAGRWQVKNSPDGHGYLTKDGSLAAHFEHTIAVTKNGPIILTIF